MAKLNVIFHLIPGSGYSPTDNPTPIPIEEDEEKESSRETHLPVRGAVSEECY
jgi:hypothetical protein